MFRDAHTLTQKLQANMAKPLYAHQVDGVKWLLNRESMIPSGGLLCDEMGLGKTIQMIEVIKTNRTKTLVVVPKSLVKQWQTEIEKFDPSCTVCVYDGSKRVYDPKCDVTVCPYSVVVDLVNELWGRVILDEGHEIRNPNSLVHKNCMRLKADTRWVLTGTPIFNNVRDFVSLCEFIRIGKKRVQGHMEDIKKQFLLRRTKNDIMPCMFENVEIQMPIDEKVLYERAYEQLAEGGEDILEGILRCRQVCAWPQLFIDGLHKKSGVVMDQWTNPTAKISKLLEFISEHPNEKSLVFTQFRGESLAIRDFIVERLKLSVFVLDGQTKNRDEIIDGFKNSRSGSVFIIQIKTGGVGLNLQEATRIYIMQPSWNLATELQAIARAHRSGQTKTVYVKKLVYCDPDVVETELVELETLKFKIFSKITGDTGNVKIPELCSASNFVIRMGKNLYDI